MPGPQPNADDRQREIDRYRSAPRADRQNQPAPQYQRNYPQMQPAGYPPPPYPFPPTSPYAAPAGMWDVVRDGVKFLAQHRLVEVLFLVVLLAIGYGLFAFFVYVEPRRQAENAALIKSLNDSNNETVKKIVVDHKEALRETKEAFITESSELRKDSKVSSERHLQMMERLVDDNTRAVIDREKKFRDEKDRDERRDEKHDSKENPNCE